MSERSRTETSHRLETAPESTLKAHFSTRPWNAFTVDVEDWVQSSLDSSFPLTDRFVRSTSRILDTLSEAGVHGTFFVLGLAAEKAPDLVREIARAGHEVQCHGYGHRSVYTLTYSEFKEDVSRAKKLLEDLLGLAITGYRAPAFSLFERTLWALDILVEMGFHYDSSIFPVKTRRYGLIRASETCRYPYRVRTPAGHELIEIPVASYRFLGHSWPTGGGGYFRLLPFSVLKRGIAQINSTGSPATVYIHPHEFDPHELKELPVPIPWTRRFQQGWGRRSVPGKIRRLLSEFRFGRVGDLLASYGPLPGVTIGSQEPAEPRSVSRWAAAS